MVAVQTDDVPASFLFVCDLNGHHQEWLGSSITNRHGVADRELLLEIMGRKNLL